MTRQSTEDLKHLHHVCEWGSRTARWFGSCSFFMVAQQGVLYAFPLILIGALTLSLSLLPFDFIQQAFRTILGDDWKVMLDTAIQSTYGIASLAILCGMSHGFAAIHNNKHKNIHINPVATIVVALACFFSIVVHTGTESWQDAFSLPRGFINAIFSASVSSYLFIRLIKSPIFRLRHTSLNGSLCTFEALRLLPAGLVCIILLNLGLFGVVSLLPDHFSVHTHNSLIAIAKTIDSPLIIGLVYSIGSQILWFFGIHGPNLLMPIETSYLTPALLDNIQNITQGTPAPHIISKAFLDVFALIGGSGSTLCLIIAILWKSMDVNLRKLVLVSLLPALMNVNEPILFGVPVLFSPVYIIPFILTPVMQILIGYASTMLSLVPVVATDVHWTCPPILSGYLATDGSLSGCVLQLVNIVAGVAIYVPFVTLSERINSQQRVGALNHLAQALDVGDAHVRQLRCINQPDIQGTVARHLAHDLRRKLEGIPSLELVYQPQFDTKSNKVVGLEALLRWQHPVYGMIPPPVIIAISEDIEMINQLGNAILDKACRDITRTRAILSKDFILSINLSPTQLTDPYLAENILDILEYYHVPAHNIELEITENIAVAPDMTTLDNLHELREFGVQIAIDDFGMGHASLRYLRELPISTIKIDKSLSNEVSTPISVQIIGSIMSFGQALGLRIVVEGVEDRKNLEQLVPMGCHIFQGYYFSRPLNVEDATQMILDGMTPYAPLPADNPPEGPAPQDSLCDQAVKNPTAIA